jgi:single-stranded DNA-binding protein
VTADTTNAWTFAGTVDRIEHRKTAKSGKEFHNLSITQPDGQYQRLCVCTVWGRLADGVAEGAEVHATGRIDGREYQGKHYAGLTASAVQVTRAAINPAAGTDSPFGDQPPAQPTARPSAVDAEKVNEQLDRAADGADDGMPF